MRSPAEAVSTIELEGLEKSFGAVRVVGPLSLTVQEGEFLSLLGPSGCGKTTTLRMIAGFEAATAGEIRIAGQPVGHLPVERRGVGMVFQSYALFPHLSVADNVGFGLRLRRRPAAERDRRVAELLELVGLAGFGPRRPRELSGGQQQRVSLARALAIEPQVLLLDEPLSSLDLKLREQMRDEIRRLQRSLGITAIAVTHDQSEAMAMSDRIAVMHGGVIAQVGTPHEIYDRPADLFVAGFIGQCTALPGRIVGPGRFETDGGAGFDVPEGAPGRATLVIRPEAVRVGEAGGAFHAVVEHVVYLGEKVSLTLRLPSGEMLLATVGARGAPALGASIPIDVSGADCAVVPDVPHG